MARKLKNRVADTMSLQDMFFMVHLLFSMMFDIYIGEKREFDSKEKKIFSWTDYLVECRFFPQEEEIFQMNL
ncbi:hypothetical protein M3596_10550 [Bacillus subtilis]|uniref:hypothetical protein n=1 Tax=Bacillus subtilis TaxID=1423 RepID=UPI0016460A74|nr:hypothetical protein [Bacillus subtilis]MCM3189202.1 hypothetical protein [Bacillus subtilis]MEC2265399.1 hypothetical protein [Bacillus subtilis]MED4457548.1 hypothetical protein [Bacillus subtilis]